jgi:hypothetical protein
MASGKARGFVPGFCAYAVDTGLGAGLDPSVLTDTA